MHWNASASSLPILYVWDSCTKQWFGKENPTTLKLRFDSQIKQIIVSVTSNKWIQFSYDILQSFGVNSHFGPNFHEHASRRKDFCLHFCPPRHCLATSSQYSHFDYRRYIILESESVFEQHAWQNLYQHVSFLKYYKWFTLLFGLSELSLNCQRGGPDLIPSHSKWYLGRTQWHWKCLCFPCHFHFTNVSNRRF